MSDEEVGTQAIRQCISFTADKLLAVNVPDAALRELAALVNAKVETYTREQLDQCLNALNNSNISDAKIAVLASFTEGVEAAARLCDERIERRLAEAIRSLLTPESLAARDRERQLVLPEQRELTAEERTALSAYYRRVYKPIPQPDMELVMLRARREEHLQVCTICEHYEQTRGKRGGCIRDADLERAIAALEKK